MRMRSYRIEKLHREGGVLSDTGSAVPEEATTCKRPAGVTVTYLIYLIYHFQGV